MYCIRYSRFIIPFLSVFINRWVGQQSTALFKCTNLFSVLRVHITVKLGYIFLSNKHFHTSILCFGNSYSVKSISCLVLLMFLKNIKHKKHGSARLVPYTWSSTRKLLGVCKETLDSC